MAESGQEHLPSLDIGNGCDQASLAHTSLRVPADLTVRPSLLSDGILGVFATTFIRKGVKMGPYVGEQFNLEDVGAEHTAFPWQVSKLYKIILL